MVHRIWVVMKEMVGLKKLEGLGAGKRGLCRRGEGRD